MEVHGHRISSQYFDLQRINYKYNGKEYEYAYGVEVNPKGSVFSQVRRKKEEKRLLFYLGFRVDNSRYLMALLMFVFVSGVKNNVGLVFNCSKNNNKQINKINKRSSYREFHENLIQRPPFFLCFASDIYIFFSTSPSMLPFYTNSFLHSSWSK